MSITVPFNPLKGKTFPVNHHFLVSLSYWTNPFLQGCFSIEVKLIMISSNQAFCGPSFLSGFSLFLSGCCFASASFVTVAGHSSLLQPLLLTKEWHASVAASATPASSHGTGSCGQGQPSAPVRPLDWDCPAPPACPFGSTQEPAPGTGATCCSCWGQRFLPQVQQLPNVWLKRLQRGKSIARTHKHNDKFFSPL